MTRELITLPDGRKLDVEVTGPADGLPLVFHHGTPSSVVPLRSMQRACAQRDLRLITYSRPGYGSSTRQPGRTVADVAADTAAVLDRIGAQRCLVAGWSGGGPHAFATGALLGARVAGVLAIASVAPFPSAGLEWTAGMGSQNVEEFGLAVQGEDALRPYLEREAQQLSGAEPAGVIEGLDSVLPDIDRAVLTDEFGQDMADGMAESLRTGVEGWLDDDLAFTKPWGFELALPVPTFIWQGSEDLMVPFAHGQWLAAHLPQATAHLEAGEGHLSIGVGALDRMLDELVAVVR